MKGRTRRLATLVVVTLAAGVWAGCSLEDPSAPALSGPSEFGTAVTLTASPDQLPRNGTAQSTVSVSVRDASNRPLAGQRLGVATNVGTVSLTEVVTDSDGRASFTFTAPPAGTVGNAAQVRVTPIGAGVDGAVPRIVTINFAGAANTTRPTAAFTFTPASPQVRQIVTFDATTTTDEGATTQCGSACTYSWNFDDGTFGSGQVVTHRFDVARSHTVTLTVTDAAGAAAGVSQTIVVTAVAAPTVTITVSPNAPTAGQQATFTATAAAAAGHSIQRFSWEFGDGTNQTPTAPTVTKTYSSPGTYTVTVTVTDDLGQSGSASTAITVGNGITFTSPVFTFSPTTPEVGDAVRFSAADVTTNDGAQITEYTWDFGDGSATFTDDEPNATHTYTVDRTYVVRLTVKDSRGRTATRTRDVPIAVFTP